jgi:hypothetical protein
VAAPVRTRFRGQSRRKLAVYGLTCEKGNLGSHTSPSSAQAVYVADKESSDG